MMEIQYISNRELKNSKGEVRGKVRIIKFKEEELARVRYKCPECGYEEEIRLPFKKPFRFSCRRCGFKMKVISLRTEIKKEIRGK